MENTHHTRERYRTYSDCPLESNTAHGSEVLFPAFYNTTMTDTLLARPAKDSLNERFLTVGDRRGREYSPMTERLECGEASLPHAQTKLERGDLAT